MYVDAETHEWLLEQYCIVSVLSLRLTLLLYLYHILSTNFYFPKIVSFFLKRLMYYDYHKDQCQTSIQH